MKKFRQRIKEKIGEAIEEAVASIGNQEDAQATFEDQKPDSMRYKDIRMVSGCEDSQTSADVSNVGNFRLPDPAGRAGGACTSTLLRILYKDEHVPDDTLSFTQVLEKMRSDLRRGGYSQTPQLTSLNKIDVHTDFDLVPESATGVRRAVMIGINYVGHDSGELRGCHNDVLNMVSNEEEYDIEVALQERKCFVHVLLLSISFSNSEPNCTHYRKNISWTSMGLKKKILLS